MDDEPAARGLWFSPALQGQARQWPAAASRSEPSM
jgi:hypothetical protein